MMAKDKGKNEKVKLAFYLKCPRCGLIYLGKEIDAPPQEVKIREYPRHCLQHDVELMPELKIFE
jgi:hypothetical protein